MFLFLTDMGLTILTVYTAGWIHLRGLEILRMSVAVKSHVYT